MRYLSVCSGIEAASVAWGPLGWEPVAFAEIDAFPSAVLAHHYPTVPNYGDVTRFCDWPDATVDVLVGGTPCQSFSVAGLRKGLADPRGNLALTYLAILHRYRPRWCVWENVPGVLSADKGHALGALLGGLGQLGYGFAYRVLDAQYFGLAQRRARVFVVGHLGDWRRAAAVLLERESLSGHPAPRRDAGQGVAPSVSCGPPFSRTGNEWVESEALIPSTGDISHCLNAGGMGRIDYETETLITFDTTQITSAANYSVPKAGDPCHPLASTAHPPAVAFKTDQEPEAHGDLSPTLQQPSPSGGGQPTAVMTGMQVRRLTPRECERLQGFRDDYTLIPYRGKPTADGPRYKALGNSMAVPVMHWIGQRIQMVTDLDKV